MELHYTAKIGYNNRECEIIFRHCLSSLELAGFNDWRIPTQQELTTLIDPVLSKSNADVPLRSPFNVPGYGYYYCANYLTPDQGYYSLFNIKNGHIFNGYGHKAFIRAVRGESVNIAKKS